MKKTVVMWQNLGDYHLARLKHLAQLMPGVVAVEISQKMKLYNWLVDRDKFNFEIVTLFNEDYEGLDRDLIFRKMVEALEKIDPGALIIPGVADAHYRRIAAWARQRGVSVICTMASTLYDKKRIWAKEVLKRQLFKRSFIACVCTGERSREYAKHLGMTDDQIWRCGNAVDNDYFAARHAEIQANRDEYRAKFSLPDDYFLFVGRLSEEKNLDRLIDAHAAYRKAGGPWKLVIVGSGPLETELKAKVAAGHSSDVVMIPWLQYNDLPAAYSLAKCFMLVSLHETWGLVVNEAMLCSLPVIVSKQCGCLPELCKRGLNGYDIDPFSTESMTGAMLKMSSPESDLAYMGKMSRALVETVSIEGWARVVKDCVLTVTAGK